MLALVPPPLPPCLPTRALTGWCGLHSCAQYAELLAKAGKREEGVTVVATWIAKCANGPHGKTALMLNAYNVTAQTLDKLGEPEKAEPLYRLLISMCETGFQKMPPMYYTVVKNFAESLENAGKKSEADELRRDKLQ